MHTPHLSRRQLLAHTAAAGLLAGLAPRAWAQADYPRQAIRLIVPYTPGGVTDLTMRTVSRQAEKTLGQPIVIDNRAGAGGAVGMTAVAKAHPDGYTIGATASSTIIATPMLNPVSYEGADFVFVSLLATVPMVLTVNPALPVRNPAEFLDYVRANKGKLNYGSTAIGHYGHVALMEVSEALQADMVHSPYKGEAPLLQHVVGGQLPFAFFAPSTAKPMAEAGKLRMLGVSGSERVRSLPDVPTLAEAGWSAPIFRMNPGWVGIVAPAKTPAAIVQRLSTAYVEAVRDPEINRQIADYGMAPVGSTSEQFAETYRTELPIWRALLTKAGLEVRG